MSSHSNRSVYFMIRGEEIIVYPNLPSAEVPTPPPEVPTNGGSGDAQPHRSTEPRFVFGRLFDEIKAKKDEDEDRKEAVIAEIIELAKTINAKADDAAGDSDIRAGYTYLGQFIAHEITFDKTEEPLEGENPGYRSPQIDLDSLYGRGPEQDPRFYQDGARLKVGETIAGPDIRTTFFADLPRYGFGSRRIGKALIPDPRNDENLPLAQTHLAFIKFHNKVVDAIHLDPNRPDRHQLFEAAKKDVCQHFQWIILRDFLPKLLHEAEGSEPLETRHPRLFKPDPDYGVFMPLEFSVAAFRFGHSMVRNQYEWNDLQNSGNRGIAKIENMFQFTGFSGDLDGKPRLESDWIIDWQRFYDFQELGRPIGKRRFNMARKIDPSFSLRLENIPGYPHVTANLDHQSIVARNLLRGYACYLPCAEDVIKVIDVKNPLTPEQIGIKSQLLTGQTPLWYYILKEAEHNNGNLGPVASFIIAETLVGLIRESQYSILNEENWKPKYGRRATGDDPKFDMVDLLDFAEFVDPLGERLPGLSIEGF